MMTIPIYDDDDDDGGDDDDDDDDDDIWQEQEQAMDSDRGFTSLSQVLSSPFNTDHYHHNYRNNNIDHNAHHNYHITLTGS